MTVFHRASTFLANSRLVQNGRRVLLAAVFAFMAGVGLLGPQSAAHAQTPVPITIDTNSLLTQVNTWTASLDDVVFLGVAISIAIALLTFIGAQILKAFRGSSG
jgi:hypothetical protein